MQTNSPTTTGLSEDHAKNIERMSEGTVCETAVLSAYGKLAKVKELLKQEVGAESVDTYPLDNRATLVKISIPGGKKIEGKSGNKTALLHSTVTFRIVPGHSPNELLIDGVKGLQIQQNVLPVLDWLGSKTGASVVTVDSISVWNLDKPKCDFTVRYAHLGSEEKKKTSQIEVKSKGLTGLMIQLAQTAASLPDNRPQVADCEPTMPK